MKINKRIDEPVQTTPFELMGGDARVRALVDRFYDLMDGEGHFAELRALHPPDLAGSRDKLYWFLSGWLGGPQLYTERFGNPMLRARHLPFAISNLERDQWMSCMKQALLEAELPANLYERLVESFQGTADWMRNRS